ncbi:MAG: hypothetical protein ACI9TK_000054 [Flavobacteriaceae bacterium]|jgi:hypothetical protein
MFTKIFKKVSIESLISSFFFCVLAFFFNTYCIKAGNIDSQALVKTLVFFFFALIAIFIVSFSQARRLNTLFGAIQLMSLPLCFLIFIQEGGLSYNKVIVLLIVLIMVNVLSKNINNTISTKTFFILGFLGTIISYINIYYALFFITPILIFSETSYRNIKNLIVFCVAIIFSLQSLLLLSFIATGTFFYEPAVLKTQISVSGDYSPNDLVWTITVFIALLTATIFRPSEHKIKAQKNNTQRVFQFMLIWLLISIFFRYFNLYDGTGKWLESFVPTSFFIGIAIDAIKSSQIKNLTITVVIFAAISLKLFNYGLISF